MVSKTSKVALLLVASMLNFAWAEEACLELAEVEVKSLVKVIKTIFPDVSGRSLHYLYKNSMDDHKACNENEVWVQGPSFSEDGLTSEGEETTDTGQKTYKLNNAFCMSRSQYEFERDLGKSVFQTRVSSGSKNQATSFLIGNNIIMTNYHIAAPGPDGHDCKSLEVTLNTEKTDWVPCKRVLFCDKERDYCFVEMKQASPGVELGDLVPKMKLNCAKTQKQSGMLIGNSNSYGIQASAGPISEEVNGKIKHHIPTTGGASGSPVMNNKGEVMGINYGHTGTKNFVSLNDETNYNSATSMSWIRNQITNQIQQATYSVVKNKFTDVKIEDLKKIDKVLRQNPSCQNGYLP